MRKIILILCAVLMLAVLLCGCAKRAAKDAADTVSSAVSDVKEDADKYGKVDEATDDVGEETAYVPPTMADMDKMIENGKVDDENDDDEDGNNIDDDKNSDATVADEDDDADGGEHNDETTSGNNSEFI